MTSRKPTAFRTGVSDETVKGVVSFQKQIVQLSFLHMVCVLSHCLLVPLRVSLKHLDCFDTLHAEVADNQPT